MLRRAFALVLPAVLVACGGASNSSVFEEPAADDTGVAPSDSGVADSGSGTPDSTTPIEDTDSPPPPLDTGTPSADTDPPPPVDSGVVDTGFPFPFDTGTPPPVDAGACSDPGGKTYLGHCYFPISSRTFTQARDACLAAGAHLVTITSAGEQTFVNTVGSGERWIGLAIFSGGSSWRWITSEPMAYTNWDTAAGEPNGSGYCARLKATGWADIGCNSSYPAVCERE